MPMLSKGLRYAVIIINNHMAESETENLERTEKFSILFITLVAGRSYEECVHCPMIEGIHAGVEKAGTSPQGYIPGHDPRILPFSPTKISIFVFIHVSPKNSHSLDLNKPRRIRDN